MPDNSDWPNGVQAVKRSINLPPGLPLKIDIKDPEMKTALGFKMAGLTGFAYI